MVTEYIASAFLEWPRAFHYTVPAALARFYTADYVILNAGSRKFLGQIESALPEFLYDFREAYYNPASALGEGRKVLPVAWYSGHGRILAEITPGNLEWQFDLRSAERKCSIETASSEQVALYLDAAWARQEGDLLTVGCLLGTGEPVRLKLMARGFRRPAGVFGQSDAGKSYGLGILIEELHLRTQLKTVVLDPNGDFVRLREDLRGLGEINQFTTHRISEAEYAEYRELHDQQRSAIAILSANPQPGARRIRVRRLNRLPGTDLAFLLGIDPTGDANEFAHLVHRADQWSDGGKEFTLHDLASDPAQRAVPAAVAAKAQSVELQAQRIWGNEDADVEELVDILDRTDLKTVIVDLSTLSALERTIVAWVVFWKLWNEQQQPTSPGGARRCLLVVDEAHNLFPARPGSPEQTLSLNWGSRIAGEGRKYGLHLMLSSQLPSKIHEHVLTQCGNLILMRMLSQPNIDALRDAFSFVSAPIMDMAKFFGQGDALAVGEIVASPSLFHFEGRKTREGGKYP